MLAFGFIDPKTQYVFVPIGIVSQHYIDGDLTDTAFCPHRNVDAVYKGKKDRTASAAVCASGSLLP